MKSLFTKFVVLASISFSAASAYAVGLSCVGGPYTVSLNSFNDITVAANGSLLARGVARQTDYSGWQYLAVNRNVGPQPQDMFEDYTLVVPGVVGNATFIGYLDLRRTGFNFPGTVTRSGLYCTPILSW